MKIFIKASIIFFFISFKVNLNAQNETRNWYFGTNAGLDFSTSPPNILTNGMLVTSEGCATISDASGNLLFYTDGVTVYDRTHSVMANGTGLNGDATTTQSGMIVKEPGNANIYFVFTLGASGTGSLCFSTVDLSLASGMGSVTIKNTLLSASMTEKLTAVRHCNGTDVWVISHDNNSNNFRNYLVSASGVSNTPTITGIGTTILQSNTSWAGNMKTSSNSRKLGMAMAGAFGSFEIFDFDNATGLLSNPINLGSFPNAYGCEFSPDGSKFYGDREFGGNFLTLYQWDLCAGSATAIISSQFSLAVSSQIMGMQLASDGKIYVAKYTQSILAVIANPNISGSGCNYNHNGQSVAPKICWYNLPNFMCSFFKTPASRFTYTVSCNTNTVSFTAPSNVLINTGCTASSYSTTGIQWNFGHPSSGAANTSTLINPIHIYNSLGTYTVKLIINNQCSSDTLVQTISIINVAPTLSVSGNFTICNGEKRTYTVSGANSYTWSSNAFTPTVALNPTVSSAYTVTATNTLNTCMSFNTFSITVNKCSGLNEEILDGEISVFPNPFNNVLMLDILKNTDVTITNQNGLLIYEKRFETDGKQSINTDWFSSGVYLIRISNKSFIKKIRVIKLE